MTYGYQCKRCGQPAPLGVGFAAPGQQAFEASQQVTACRCGWSRRPK